MAYAYTPGLKVKKVAIIRKRRVLPIPGEVLVHKGDVVKDDTVIAQSYVMGKVTSVPIAYILGIEPNELPNVMLKKEGDEVKEGELIAVSKSLFGLFKNEYRSKVTGKIELISDVTGVVCIREPPQPIRVNAYIPGKVVDVEPNMGAVIETKAAIVQGIFGFGGERHGELMVIGEPNEILTEKHIGKDCAGKVLVGGSLVTGSALKKAARIGVKGIVTGGICGEDLCDFLGYKIGVAITGYEDVNLTFIMTEGFGEMKMARHTYDLLKSLEGRRASINGATQIRAGVIRPECIIPWTDVDTDVEVKMKERLVSGMEIGTRVRVIRRPYFGELARIVGLPVELQMLETESYVRVAEVELDDGRRVIVPRANLEIFEE